MLADLAQAGVLEVAFGGGEPWAFRGFADLLRRLYDETPLAVSFTTNGIALTRARLQAIRGSLWAVPPLVVRRQRLATEVALLAETGARFGVNYLVTPARMAELEAVVLRLVGLGVVTVLLLSYKGCGLCIAARPSRQNAINPRQLLERSVNLLAGWTGLNPRRSGVTGRQRGLAVISNVPLSLRIPSTIRNSGDSL
jgi:hypothetical protein